MPIYDLGNKFFKYGSDTGDTIDLLSLCLGYYFHSKNG